MFLSETDIILVCVMPHPRDLEIARLFGWYRIPLRSAPKLLAVDYLAFYQPSSFGAQAGRIEYAAPVTGYELTIRAELLRQEPEHPRAQEEYFKIQLGGLNRLHRPILADRWRRFAFFYSTGAYLARAETIEDLVVQQEDRSGVWQAMRERAARDSTYRPASGSAADWPELPDSVDLAELLLFPISSS